MTCSCLLPPPTRPVRRSRRPRGVPAVAGTLLRLRDHEGSQRSGAVRDDRVASGGRRDRRPPTPSSPAHGAPLRRCAAPYPLGVRRGCALPGQPADRGGRRLGPRGPPGSLLGAPGAVRRRSADLPESNLAPIRRDQVGELVDTPPSAAAAASAVDGHVAGSADLHRGERPLLRSHQVAVAFGVSERTLINWAASGKLPSVRTVGGQFRFRQEDVAALLGVIASRNPPPK